MHPCNWSVGRWRQNQTSYEVCEWCLVDCHRVAWKSFGCWQLLLSLIESEALWPLATGISSFQITFWCVSVKRCWPLPELWMWSSYGFPQCWHLLQMCCASKVVTILPLLWLFVALGVIGFVFLFQRKCAHLLLKKIHLAGLFTGKYCFASLAAGLGCWGFRDASSVWYTAVLGCYGWQWNEGGWMQLTSPSHI